jgi:hypothetical protein
MQKNADRKRCGLQKKLAACKAVKILKCKKVVEASSKNKEKQVGVFGVFVRLENGKNLCHNKLTKLCNAKGESATNGMWYLYLLLLSGKHTCGTGTFTAGRQPAGGNIFEYF